MPRKDNWRLQFLELEKPLKIISKGVHKTIKKTLKVKK